MRAQVRTEKWLNNNEQHPSGLWFLGRYAYSYWLLIGKKESNDSAVRLLDGPRSSVTTQKHRGIIRRTTRLMGLDLIDEYQNEKN